MIVYHHNDMDGKAAAHCVHTLKPRSILDSASSYVMMTYDEPFDKHETNDDVFIVDLSFTEQTYPALLEVCKTARTVTWIDHHDSSMEVVANHKDELQAIRNLTYFVSKAACGAALTYIYFNIPTAELFKVRTTEENEEYEISATFEDRDFITVTLQKTNKKDPTDTVWHSHDIRLPSWLYYIDDYDCWKKKDPDTEFFMLGCDTRDTAFTKYIRKFDRREFNRFWETVSGKNSDHECSVYIRIGKHISNYIHSKYHKELRHTFEWEFEGTKFLCKNDTCGNSWCFENLIENYPAVIRFQYSGKTGKWMYSVYSAETSSFNCKEFCEKFGGGGHQHAAGFSTKELIFTNVPKPIKPIIFLGGTCGIKDLWRPEFMKYWKDAEKGNKELGDFEIVDPFITDREWTESDKDKENEVKSTACVNLFLINPATSSSYSIAEAIESVNNYPGKTILAIENKHNNPVFSDAIMKSFDAIGSIVESHGGVYIKASGQDCMKQIVDCVIKAASEQVSKF